jgi:hypothetical protein
MAAFRAIALIATALLAATCGGALATDIDVVFRGAEFPSDAPIDKVPGTGVLPERFALVIGVGSYGPNKLGLTPLKTPAKDAASVAAALGDARFDVTSVGFDKQDLTKAIPVSRNALLNAIETFNDKIRNYKGPRPPVVAFYFAGHGVSALGPEGRTQYLVPSDFQPLVHADVAEMAVSLEAVLARLGSTVPALRLVFIDACRSAVDARLPGGPGGADAAYEQWRKFEPKDQASKDGARNGLLVAYATDPGNTARDDGKLAEALTDKLQRMREGTAKSGSGRDSSFSELVNAIKLAVQGPTGSDQRAEQIENTTKFNLFATQRDLEAETFNWTSAKHVRDQSAVSSQRRFVCRLKTMKEAFTEYSYLSPLVAFTYAEAVQMAGEPTSCGDTDLSTTLDHSDKLNEAAKPNVRRLDESTAPKLGNVSQSGASKLDQSVSADRLAYAAYETVVYEKASLKSAQPAKLAVGDLVQLRDGSTPAFTAVRTIGGVEGFVKSDALLAGRAALDVTLQFGESQFHVAPEELGLSEILPKIVATDALVTFPVSDDLLGLSRAQAIGATLTQIVNGGQTAKIFTPRIVAVGSDSPKQDQLARDQARVVLSFAPLSKDLRLAMGAPSIASRLTASDSMDLAQIVARVPELASAALIRPASEGSGPRIVARQGQGLSDAQLCANAVKDLPRASSNARVYIQIFSPEQRRDYDKAASGLRANGYVVPAVDLRPSTGGKTTDVEVRYCPGGDRAASADGAVQVLKRCGYPARAAAVASKGTCRKVAGDVVEIWFADKGR